MKKKLLALLGVLVTMTLMMSAYAKPYGTIRVATADFGNESTDPINLESFWGIMMYDQLASQNEKGDYVPMVATDWKITNGTTWTFHIRKGIRFHNGDPLTAEDVAWSLERFASPESTNPWSGALRANLKSVTATDKYTVVLETNFPESALIVPIAWTRILPKKYFNEVGQDAFRKKPIGSGPWKWGKLESKVRVELTANEDYWEVVPKYAKYVEYMVPEESTRVAMFKRGDIDYITGLAMDRNVELEKMGYRLEETGPPTVFTMNYQGTWFKEAGPMYYKKFRKALSYSVDAQLLCDTIYLGKCRPGGQWYMFEGTWGWDPSWKPDPYDPELAKQYLKDVGYPEKFDDPVIQINTYASFADQVQALIGFWEDIGIKTKINVLDNSGMANYIFIRLKDKNAPNVGQIFPWIFPVVLNNVYHSGNMYKSTGAHSTGNDPKADELYDDAVKEMDPVKAKQKWTKFREYGREMWVTAGFVEIPSYSVFGPKLGKISAYQILGLQDASNYLEHP